MDVMVYLVEHGDEVSSKKDIMEAVWADTFVTDGVLKHAIFDLRRALEDDAQNPRFIQTIPRKGYRLMAAVTRPGPDQDFRYRIVNKLGQGGMGEVFLAEDSLLRRKVALKFVREDKQADETYRKRLLREARSAAALDHVYIARIYDMGERDGKAFIVMKYVEGPTLKETLGGGPLPAQEALPLAAQMAAALEEAHNKGIIHRDFKPANITVTSEGRIKVLDFGLAKAVSSESSAADLSDSTSITIEGGRAGVIAGTTPYMSPEQARGQAVDKQTDIWAFGCVLYECLGGKKPFDGETPTDVLGALVGKEPDWDSLPGDTPAGVRSLLTRCLQKDADKRLHDIADARIEIEDVLANPEGSEVSSPAVTRVSWRWVVPLALVILALGAVIGAVIWNLGTETAESSSGIGAFRSEINLPEGERLVHNFKHGFALSPDGTRLAFVSATETGQLT